MQKLAFIYNAKIPEFSRLGRDLEQRYGATAVADADVLVPVGGDGSVLYGLNIANGRPVYGITPPGSTSVAYTANAYSPVEDLAAEIAQSERIPLFPLQTVLTYDNGSCEALEVFSVLSVERTSGQASMLELTATFNNSHASERIVGNGLAFSTALGSTGYAWSLGGPIMMPDTPAIIMNGIAVGRPRGFNPVVAGLKDRFSVNCHISHTKRPVRLDIDGSTHGPASVPGVLAKIDLGLKDIPTACVAIRRDAYLAGAFHPFRRLSVG